MKYALLVLGLSVAGASGAAAETVNVSAGDVEYTNHQKEDQSGRQCEISLAEFSKARTESLNFRVQISQAKASGALEGPLMIGYSLDVGDMAMVDGKPDHVVVKPISNDAFAADGFKSPGRLTSVKYPDGAIGATTDDGDTGAAFVQAFYKGNFSISFDEGGSAGQRTYAVVAPVPKPVVTSFIDCLAAFQ
jgi:hypothetical protein